MRSARTSVGTGGEKAQVAKRELTSRDAAEFAIRSLSLFERSAKSTCPCYAAQVPGNRDRSITLKLGFPEYREAGTAAYSPAP